jgi:hypothetical protein
MALKVRPPADLKKSGAVLPDGFFSDQKYQFGKISEDRGMKNVVIYSGHLQYFTTIGYILWAFWVLVYFPPLWYIVSRKIWQPLFVAVFRNLS